MGWHTGWGPLPVGPAVDKEEGGSQPEVWSVDTLPLATHPSLGGTSLEDPRSASGGTRVGKLASQELNYACSTGQPTWFLVEVHQQ